MKRLSQKHIHAAKMLHEGNSNQVVADAVGVGLRTVEGWVSMPVFAAELERLQAEQQQRNRTELDDAAEFQAEVRRKTRDFYKDVQDQISDAVAALDPIGLSRSLPPLVKAMRDLTELALATDASTLGLEELAKEVDAINQAQA